MSNDIQNPESADLKDQDNILILEIRIGQLANQLKTLRLEKRRVSMSFSVLVLSIVSLVILTYIIISPFLGISQSVEIPFFIQVLSAFIIVFNLYWVYKSFSNIQADINHNRKVELLLQEGEILLSDSQNLFRAAGHKSKIVSSELK